MDMTEHWLATTERGLAEEALRKSEERWRAVFENSAIGVALTDQSGRFLAANSAYQKMLGFASATEFLPKLGIPPHESV